AGFGTEPVAATGSRAAIGGDPVAELRLAADELAAAALGVIPLVDPAAVDQQAHRCFLACREGDHTPPGRSAASAQVLRQRKVLLEVLGGGFRHTPGQAHAAAAMTRAGDQDEAV